MSLKPLLSFSSGELDPILHDNVTLGKFQKGLATARNIMIGKTGSMLSRFARAHFVKAKNNNEAIKLFSPSNSGYVTEWGNLYVRVYDFTGTLLLEDVHSFTEADLPDMHFVEGKGSVYIFVKGKQTIRLIYDDPTLGLLGISGNVFFIPLAPTIVSITATGAPAGYAVDYLITTVVNGEESIFVENSSGSYNKPDATGQKNTLTIKLYTTVTTTTFNEIRVYRRPHHGGAYGYLGSSTYVYASGPDLHVDFEDLGGLADFTNGPPEDITKSGFENVGAINLYGSTGIVYQQRLLTTARQDEEAIFASRPGYFNNFYRDFPYDADSSLQFKSGTSGRAKVLRMIENDGLIVFTSIGVFINLGVLNIDNLALERKGSWVINETIPPLSVPGGVFFVDKSSNSVRQFIFSQDIQAYQSVESSIFSKHLFRNRTITSWAFQDGVAPLIIVTFTDGTFATFTYDFEHQMRAWARHDSDYPIEQVEGTDVSDSTFFVTNKDGQRYIEVSLPRYIPADTYESNPEADKLALNTFMDAAKTKSNLLNDSLVGSDVFLLVPVTPGDYEGNLTLTCGTSALFPDPGLGEVGTIFRFFDITDKSTVDLTVVSRASDDQVVVSPSAEFPSAQVSGFRLYETFDTVTGLDHLEGENVSVMIDGYVINSPNNDVENYPAITVASGEIDLPERGAIIIVGRPITADIETLNISTVEQSPTMIESLTVDKLYMRLHETRGLHVSNRFPEEKTGGKDGSSVIGMEDLDVFYLPDGFDVVGNRYKEPISKRIEQTIPGHWESQGKMAIRQVDPVHFEILSIIPDIEVLKRSNR